METILLLDRVEKSSCSDDRLAQAINTAGH